MDLKHDWRTLNEVLFPSEGAAPASLMAGSSVVLLEDKGRIVEGVVSSGTIFQDVGMETGGAGTAAGSLTKAKLDGIAAKYGVEKTILLSKWDLDQAVADAARLGSNYFQQLTLLRERLLKPSVGGAGGAKAPALIVSRRHFVLDLVGSPWMRRLLPRRFNLMIFIDQRQSLPQLGQPNVFGFRSILLSYANGRLDQFFEPDFSSLHENRIVEWTKQHQAVGQYLENRYLLPCFGLFMYKDVWERCMEAAATKERSPWRLFTRYFDDGRAAVYPNSWLAKTLLASQRLMVYFGRL